MRFLHFSTSDGPGGAGSAAYRLHAALRDHGHASRMLVRHRSPLKSQLSHHNVDDRAVQAIAANPLVTQLRRLQKHLPFVRPSRARFTFNHDIEPGIRWQREIDDAIPEPPDAICLHWVADFLTSKSIRAIGLQLGCPILWTVMDQEPITGGCHYSFGCRGFESECGNCPLLENPSPEDRSRQVFVRKQRYLADLPLTFVAPTSWVEDRIRRSALFGRHRVERIALPIDTSVFRAGDCAAARDRLGVARDKQVIFVGSSYLQEPRKGGAYLVDALRRLHDDLSRSPHSSRNGGDVLLLMAGRNSNELKRDLPFPVCDVGFLGDDHMLAMAYRAADVFVCASIEDAGPMMIPEAMLCGTPVVAFDTGGAPDLIVSGQTGYLAPLQDAAALARAIQQVLASSDRDALGRAAALAAQRLHDPQTVVAQYAALVTELNDAQRRLSQSARSAAA